jgi:hypothetical protein
VRQEAIAVRRGSVHCSCGENCRFQSSFPVIQRRPLAAAGERGALILAIAERVRSVIADQPVQSVNLLAATLHAKPEDLRSLLEGDGAVDIDLLIGIIAVLVRESGIDPQWLLTGQYNPPLHRRALLLAADGGMDGERAMREFVREQYDKLFS